MFRSLILLGAPAALLPCLLASPHHIHKRQAYKHPPAQARASALPSSILHDVNVVDVVTGSISPHRDILIRGERIEDIRPAATRGRTERFVIPGLWDMHVHLWNEDPQLGLFLANGVIGVRDMGSDLNRIRALQARIENGEVAGPRIYASGPAVASAEAPGSRMPVNIIRTPNEARRIFDWYYDRRVNFIHVLDLDPRSFEALAERSRHDGIPFAGDLPDSVPAALAAEDRMVSIEHLSGIGLACSSRQEELRNRLLAHPDSESNRAIAADAMNSYDENTAGLLWDLFRRYGVRQTPSLTRASRLACLNAPEDGIRYVSESTRKEWKPQEPEADRAQYDFALRVTRDMARAGVPILAGTDTGEPWTAPGFELHRELELLVSAGLSTAEALRAATVEPARLMRRDDSGEVKKGFAADLVVLGANPLADISNVRNIDAVIVRGKLFHRAAALQPAPPVH